MRFCRLALLVSLAFGSQVRGEVEFVRIHGLHEFAESTEPGAMQYACASKAELCSYFERHNLRFDAKLVRPYEGRETCHIYYEPTLKGFRASTEDRPIRGIIANADPSAFVVRHKPAGDGFSIIKHVLARLQDPITVDLRVNEHYDSSSWPAALKFHFGELQHTVDVLPTSGINNHPWAQDFVKSGAVDGELKILVPRRIFEGREADGEIHRPMLEGLQGDPFVRSKLSWEGGDLIVARDPRDHDRRILVHGGAALGYWGADLPPEDYEWVLMTEFGAEIGIGLHNSASHIDFVFSFLPNEPTALVAEAVRANGSVAGAIVDALQRFWGSSAPESLQLLKMSVEDLFRSPGCDTLAIRQQIDALRAESARMRPPISRGLSQALDNYVAAHCPDQPNTCFDNVVANRKMLESDGELARQAADLAVESTLYERLPSQLLSLLEGQLPDAQPERSGPLEKKVRELRKLGFRVIRTPHLYGADGGRTWPGVGYTNMLAVGRQLFIPTFELGAAEANLLADFKKRLDGDYEVVPVPARLSLLDNGGVHCVFGVVREP
jgi:hypothetical protein